MSALAEAFKKAGLKTEEDIQKSKKEAAQLKLEKAVISLNISEITWKIKEEEKTLARYQTFIKKEDAPSILVKEARKEIHTTYQNLKDLRARRRILKGLFEEIEKKLGLK